MTSHNDHEPTIGEAGRCIGAEGGHFCDLVDRHTSRHVCACGRLFGPVGQGGITRVNDDPDEQPPVLRPVKGFDPDAIAAEAVARGEDPLAAVVGQLVGYASTCWERLNDAGTFESDRAAAATDSAIAWLRQ